MGYNAQSQNTLSQKLTSADVPTLISLVADEHLHVGVQFALASQCEAAIIPVRESVVQHKMLFLDAEDVMRLIEDFAVCTPETRQRASAMRSEIHALGKAEQTGLEQEANEKAAEDARIQRNALKMTDPHRSIGEISPLHSQPGPGGGSEFPWAYGPPIGMRVALLRSIDSKRVTCDFRRSVIVYNRQVELLAAQKSALLPCPELSSPSEVFPP
jgi:hypothetical protein